MAATRPRFHAGPSVPESATPALIARTLNGALKRLETAISGTIGRRVDGWVTPQEYGARGDGITDDAPAFATAIGELPEAGILLVPPPPVEYRFDSDPFASISKAFTVLLDHAIIRAYAPLTLGATGNNQRIIGRGARSSRIIAGTGWTATDTLLTIGKSGGAFNCHIDGIHLNGNDLANVVLDLNGTQEDCTPRNVRVTNFLTTGVKFTSNDTQNMGLANFEITNGATGSVGVEVSGGSGRLFLVDGGINLINTGTDCVLHSGVNADLYIENLHVENAANGVRKTTAAPLTVVRLEAHDSIVDLVEIASGVSNYILAGVSLNGATNILNDVNRSITLTQTYLGFFTSFGVGSPTYFGSAVGAPWVLSGDWFLEAPERSGDPSAPSANRGRVYFRDNGSGKTQMCVRFPTGAVQVLATEP